MDNSLRSTPGLIGMLARYCACAIADEHEARIERLRDDLIKRFESIMSLAAVSYASKCSTITDEDRSTRLIETRHQQRNIKCKWKQQHWSDVILYLLHV